MTALDTIYDPEFGISVVDLGLIYDVVINDSEILVDMTLTTPACPASQILTNGVRNAVAALSTNHHVDVRLVWSPQWTPDRINEVGREHLGWN